MFHSFILEDVARQRHAELLAEAEKSRLIALASQASEEESPRPADLGWQRVVRIARLVKSGLAARASIVLHLGFRPS